MEVSNCADCGHSPHDAGECRKCNCGQSEVIQPHTKYQPYPLSEPAHRVSATRPTFDKGRQIPKRKVDY